MHIRLATEVDGHYLEVMDRFDLDLFEALKPKVGKMEVEQFTGSKKGDIVSINFLSPVKAKWVSEITEDGSDEHQAYFIDEGVTLPFPLKYWQHRHIVKKVAEDKSLIIDDITYKASNGILSLLMYPALFLSFYPRKKVYRRYFKQRD